MEAGTPPAWPARYRIEYGDAFGEVTAREIILHAVAREPVTGFLFLQTRCLMRNAERTFRVDRLLSVWTAEGIRVGDPAAHFLALANAAGGADLWGGEGPTQSIEETSHARVIDRARAGINGLLWLAAADGEVSEPEMDVIFAWIDFRAKSAREGDFNWNRDAARLYVRTSRPTLPKIRGGLGRMGKAEASTFVEYMENLIKSDGGVHRLETRRREQLLQCLPQSVRRDE